MKPASGETDSGGDMRPKPMVEGLSLDILWVRERILCGGEAIPDDGRDMAAWSAAENVMTGSARWSADLDAGPLFCKTAEGKAAHDEPDSWRVG
jgi:hypothetical protein